MHEETSTVGNNGDKWALSVTHHHDVYRLLAVRVAYVRGTNGRTEKLRTQHVMHLLIEEDIFLGFRI
jgi:hypothetical protein